MSRLNLIHLRGTVAVGIALFAALAGCASVEENLARRVEYILSAREAVPGHVVAVGCNLPLEIKSGRVEFLGRTYPLRPYKYERGKIQAVFLPVPLETSLGDCTLNFIFTAAKTRKPIGDSVSFQILPDLRTYARDETTNPVFNADLLRRDLDRIRGRLSQSTFAAERLHEFSLPVSGQVVATFGTQRTYNRQITMRVDGIEIAPITRGGGIREIAAAAEGRVVLAESLPMLGNVVLVDHGFFIATLYAHLADASVKAGDTVMRGQIIGRIGNTGGAAAGTRLRYQMFVAGEPVDPQKYTGTEWFRQQ